MKYTKKSDIIGLSFRHRSNNSATNLGTLYTVVENNGYPDRCKVTYGKSHSVSYKIEEVCKYLNEGTWIPVTKNDDYEVY